MATIHAAPTKASAVENDDLERVLFSSLVTAAPR
jgi:hypothetical protein